MTPDKKKNNGIPNTRLRQLLKEIRPYSAEAVAIVKHTGCERSTIWRIREGHNYPSLTVAQKLVDYFLEHELTIGQCYDPIADEVVND